MLCVGYDVCYSAIITQVNLVLRRFTFAHVTSRRDHYAEVLYDITFVKRNIILALRLVSETTNVVCNSRGKRKVGKWLIRGRMWRNVCLPFGRGEEDVKLVLSA